MKNKIYKLLSIVLSVLMVFSCCSVAFTAYAEEITPDATYYISAAGSDETGTGTADAPFLSVGAAIAQATTDELNVAGKTVAIHVTNENNDTSQKMWGTLSAANCDLIIYADNAQTRLHNSSGSIALTGKGSVTFKNIYATAPNYANFTFGNKNVSFDSGSRLAAGAWGGYLAIGEFNTGSSTTTPLYFDLACQSTALYLCDPQSARTFKNSLYVTYDSANSQEFYLGCPRTDLDCVTTYTQPVNFNIKSATAVTFGAAVGSTRFTDNGLIQVINSSGKELTGLDTIVTAKVNTTTAFEQDDTPVTKWIINNTTTELKDVLSFTDTVGVYNVAEGYTATAVKADDDSVVVASAAKEGSQDVVLDLSEYGAGTYNVTVEKLPQTVTYYVSAAGSDDNDGESADNALASIAKAVELANTYGCTEKDTVYVKTVGADAITTTSTIPAHAFKLIVTANDTAVKGVISGAIQLGGETEFDYVTIKGAFGFAGNSAVFGDNADLGGGVTGNNVSLGKTASSMTTTAPINVKVANYTCWGLNFKSGGYWDGTTHNYPVTIEIDKWNAAWHGERDGGFVFYGGGDGVKTTYNAPVNIKVNESNIRMVLKGASGKSIFNDGFAFQLINSTGKPIVETGDTISRDDGSSSTHTNALDFIDDSKEYILHNESGDKDLLDFTSDLGIYKVNSDMYEVIATSTGTDAKVYKSEDGYLEVPAGEYTITKERKSNLSATYYVSSTDSDETGDGSEDAPFATVAEAINAANTTGYIAGDTVTVKVVGETAAEWGTGAEAFGFLLKVVSSDTENLSSVIANQTLTGEVFFDYINVKSTRSNTSNPYRIYAAGHNVTLGSNATITDYFEIVTATSQATHTTQNIVINSNYVQTLLLGHNNSGYLKYTGDVNVTVNNANASPTIKFLGHYGGDVTFNANLNFNFKDIKSFAVSDTSMTIESGTTDYTNGRRSGTASVSGAAQLIMPGAATVSEESLTNFKSLSSTYYIVRNNTDEVLDFTATAGVYTVSGSDVVYAYKDGVKVAESADGTLDLASVGAGEYTLIKTREAQTFNYTNADGTTIADMIAKAINSGAIEGDKLVITLTGTDAIEYGTPVEHLFDVEIVSTESTPVSFVSQAILAGDTKFDGVKVSYPSGENTLWLGGYNVTFTANTTISGGYYIGFGAKNNNITVDNQTVVIDCSGPMYLNFAGDWSSVTRTGDLNVSLGAEGYAPKIYFGSHNTNTYTGVVNIDLGPTTGASFIDLGDDTLVLTGGINIIGKNAVADTTYLDSIDGNIYTVADKDGLVTFGNAAGKFNVVGEDVVRAIGANGYTDSVDGVLNLTALGEGHYTLGLPHVYDGEETDYADYIDYRDALNGNDALNNFAAKVKNGEDVNVVYYGGSVTAGSGATVADTTSWRGIISNWLKVNAPNSTVTNVNSAIGGTGSHFGFYRLQGAVLDKQPDLLFIEFSINDYYDNQDQWNIGETRAAMQMESIVRKVRTELPDCDIVIVLTTEKSLIGALQTSDTLHAQAIGHSKIAEKYGIPTIRVGHALADHLATTGEAWEDYVTDIVHPNDKGYRVYANVVEEFMANSLFGTKNANAVVKDHTVPSNLVSEKIWAGDPVFIAANDALNEESTSLGGDTFTVHSGPANGRPYPYHENFFGMGDTNAVLKFKFTGTELSVLDDQYSHAYHGFNVKIDGGEEKYVAIRNYKPTILASGLENVEHTAEIRIAEVEKGGNQWVYGFFVRDEADNIEKTAEEATYYVSASGTEAGAGTKNDPVQTVAQAITLGNAAGLVGRDFVTVKVMGTAVDMGAIPAHTFNLTVESNDPAVKTQINIADATLANNVGGVLHYKNVNLYMTAQWKTATIGHMNATFGSDVTFGGAGFNSIAFGTNNDGGSGKPIAGQTFVWNSPSSVYSLGLSNSSWSGVTYTDDVNVILDSTNFNAGLLLNTYHEGKASGSTKYNANLNVIIKNAKGVSFAQPDGATFGGAIQVINSAGLNISSSSSAVLADITAPKWIITNNTGNKDIISVTETAGIYKVNVDPERYTVVATSADGTKVKASQGGTLDLTSLGAGDYTLSVVKEVEQLTYYISATGSDETGDGSLGDPYATVMKVIEAAKEYGLFATDSVIINVIGTDAVNYSLVDNTNVDEAHAYPITVQSVDPANKGTLRFGIAKDDSSDGKADEKWITGDMIFNNIKVVDYAGGTTLHANGYNVTLGEGTTAPGTLELSEQQVTHTDEQTIVINNAYTGTIHTSNGNYSSVKFNEDVNIIINNASANPTIGGTSYWGGGVTTYAKNLNVIVKQAAGLKFGSNATTHTPAGSSSPVSMSTVVNGAVNLLVPSTIELSSDSITNLNALTTNVYHVVNALGNAGDIEFTGETGKYTVNVDKKYNAYVTDSEGTSTLIEGTDLSIDAAGKYTVSATRQSDNVIYYAQAGGTGDGSSAESPLGSVNAVIKKAIAEDWNYEQFTVKVMVVGTDALPWDEEAAADLTAHKFTLIIDSETEGAKVGNNATIHMGGNIEINNVQLCMGGTASKYPSFALNGYDAVIGDNVTSDSAYWTFVNGRNSGGCTPADDQYVTINSAIGTNGFSMSNAMSAATYNNNVYFTYNVAGGTPAINFNSSWGDSKYNGNVTIDIVNAKSATFSCNLGDGESDGASQCVFGENAKVQVIDRVGLGLSTATAGLANIPAGKLWVVTDETGDLGTMDTTDTVGVYNVDCDEVLYTIKAVGETTYAAENGTLTIPAAGTYTVKAVRNAVADVLYVSANGSSVAAGTIDDPFLTVADAIAAAVDYGYGTEDTITIKLVGETVDSGTIPAYEFNLIVTSADANTKSKLNLTDAVLTNNEGGETRFSNVAIARTAQYSAIQLNGANVTFDSDVTISVGYGTSLVFGTSNDDGFNKTLTGQNVVINSTAPGNIVLSNRGWAGKTYTEDVNLVLNNSAISTAINFNASYEDASNGTTVFDKNLNINVKDASAVSFIYGAGVTVNGGLQIINSSNDVISLTEAGLVDVTGDKWVINNKLGAENIDFTETAGTFTLDFDTDNYYVTITDAEGNVSRSSSTTLTVEPGEYTVEKVRIPKEASYILSANDELASIEAAILKANEDGYIAGDTVTFFISGETTVPFGTTLKDPLRLTDYEYKLIITTKEGEDQRTVGGDKATVRLSGPTEFQNIKLDVNGTSSSYPTFGLGGNDVTFNPETSISGTYWSLVTSQHSNNIDVKEAMDLYIGTALPLALKIGNTYTGNTYSNDVNITYNVANAGQTFTFGTNATEKTNFKKNVNFNLMAGTGFAFDATGYTFAEGSAIQVINSTNVAIDSTTGVFGELTNTAGGNVPKYIITNKTGKADAISFTENAGTYDLDIGDIKYDGYYAIITNDVTGEVIHAKGDNVTLPAGEYTVTTGRDPWTKEYTITEGTLADAVQATIDEGFGYGDDVTFKLGTLEEINVGALPKYTFNLVIESEVGTRLVMNEGHNEIANNQGAHTHFKNVEIYKEAKWGTINLAGSSATFDSDVVITTGGFATLTFGVSADQGAQVLDTEQKVVLDCAAPTYIAMSSWNYANRTYNDDVTLVLNNRDTDTTIYFNAYYSGAANGETNYLGNININVKQAKAVRFRDFEGAAPGETTYLQLLVNGNTTIDQEQVSEFNTALGYDEMFYVVDNTFQRGVLDFTDEVGVYKVNTDYEASASVAQTFDPNEWVFVDVENGDTATVDENNIISIYNNDQYIDDWGHNFTNVWEVRTNEYFEDFNDTTLDELHDDWKFSSDSTSVNAQTELTEDGALKIVTQHNVKEIPALNKNLNISSKEQHISMDMKGDGFDFYNGLEILGRLGGSGYAMDAYSFHVSGLFITLEKLNGNPNEKNASGYYSYNTNGIESDGLWGRLPGGVDKDNSYSFNAGHTYRVSLSVTTDYENGDEIAYVRGIILNLTTNQVVFDEVFKDTDPYDGTEFAICSPGAGSNVYIDNVYFSTEKQRDGDAGVVEGDINGDGVYDLLDLVYVGEKIDGADHYVSLRNADLNGDGIIGEGDIPAIRYNVLTDYVIGGEFNHSGASDEAADALREQILGATSTLNGKVYTATNNGEVVLQHTISGNIWYVSSKATGTGNAGTKANPWTLAELQSNIIMDDSYASSTYKNCKVREGDAVLFERGSEFRTDNLLRDVSTSDPTKDSYAYLFMSEGTFYGAYGTGAKPKFIDSVKNYAEVTWNSVAGQENLYVIDAPELIIDMKGDERGTANGLYAGDNGATNIVFDGGAKVGHRRPFPTSATNGKVYTVYKDGQFTYDVTTGKLYLYSENGNPGDIYTSIEVSRPIGAIQINSHEGNVVIDNLSFHGFGQGTIGSSYGTNGLTVTNCDIGYSGGTFMGTVRGGNAIGGWCGGSAYKINHNWIYQTWDSAISPQGNTAISYDGFEVIGNLLEYNNCDIEIFDRGTAAASDAASATWRNCDWSNNIMRFTSLGWGSREADKIRGIQGVIRGSFVDASVVDIDWTNNIIDSPGMEIVRLDNTTNYSEGADDTINTLAIFKFGQGYAETGTAGESLLGNNTYYLNAGLRKTHVVVREYKTMTPEDYAEVNGGATEPVNRAATTAAEFYNAITAVENQGNSHFFWGGVEVTSGN